jgi:hypothetical protein
MSSHPQTQVCIAVAGIGMALTTLAVAAMFRKAPEVPTRGRLLLWAWLSAPYIGIVVTALLFRSRHSAAATFLTGAVINAAFGAFSLFGIVRSTSSTTAVGILFLSLVQWLGVLATALIAVRVGRW